MSVQTFENLLNDLRTELVLEMSVQTFETLYILGLVQMRMLHCLRYGLGVLKEGLQIASQIDVVIAKDFYWSQRGKCLAKSTELALLLGFSSKFNHLAKEVYRQKIFSIIWSKMDS